MKRTFLRNTVFISSFFLLSVANANVCVEFSNLKGFSKSASEKEYKLDGFNDQIFKFTIDHKNNIVHADHLNPGDLRYSMINSDTIVGLFNEDGKKNIETWTIDKKNAKVYFNRTRVFPNDSLTTSGSYVGDIKDCEY